MGLTNNLGKLSNMITSTGSAVGIGTSSPSYTLDVTGTGRFTGTITAGAANGNIRLSGATTDAFIGVNTSTMYLTDWTTAAIGMTINLSTGVTTNTGNLTANGVTIGASDIRSSSNVLTLGGTSEVIRITGGNVGISTSAPYAPLQVNGNIHRAWTSAGTTGSPASQEGFVYSEQSNANALAGMWFENNFQSGSAVSVVFKYRSNGASVTEGMRLTAGGLLSIGTSNPYFNTPGITVGGAANSYFGVWQDYSGTAVGLEMTNNAGTLKIQFFGSSGNYYFAGSNISDRRAKSNIQEITEGLSKISKLKPSTFTYDKNPDIVKGGFIAQEVLEVMPEFVTIPEDENEMMGVDYFGILALAVKSIQELEARIKTLENK